MATATKLWPDTPTKRALRSVSTTASTTVPTTPFLQLNLPPTGMAAWGGDLNNNFVTLDSAVGALQNSYQGDWVNNQVYALGQIVIYNGQVFISLTNGNVNLPPDKHPEAWGPLGAATSIPYPPTGVAVSTGTGWGASINPASIPSYPNKGIAVSTGSAWDAAIDPATVVRTNPTTDTTIDHGWTRWINQASAPAAVPGNGANVPGSAYTQINGPAGQDTTGTSGQTGGHGGATLVSGGPGGVAPAGSTTGAGGNLFLSGGRAGTGAGTLGVGGDVLINNNWGNTYIGGTSNLNGVVVNYGGGLSATNITVPGTPYTTNISNSGVHSRFISIYKDTSQPGQVELLGMDSSNGQQIRYFQGLWSGGVPQCVLQGTVQAQWNTSNSSTPNLAIYNDNSANGINLLLIGQSSSFQNPLQMSFQVDPTQGPNGAGAIHVIKQGVAFTDLRLCPNGGTVYTGGGGFIAGGGVNVRGATPPNTQTNSLNLSFDAGNAIAYYDAFGNAGRAQIKIRSGAANGSSTIDVLDFDGAGTASFGGLVHVGGYLVASEQPGHPNMGTSYSHAAYTYNLGVWSILAASGDGGTPGWWQIGGFTAGGGSGFTPYATFQNSGCALYNNLTCTGAIFNLYSRYGFWTNGDQLFIDTSTTGAGAHQVVINYNSNNPASGGLMVYGNLACSGAKPFVITHPLDRTKLLTHAAIEGPEAGVYYRGEAETLEGRTEITLPDYFEALTIAEGRTVQLTAIVEEGETPSFAILAAGRVSGGRFTAYSSIATQKFCWEVKAIRRDTTIDVVSDKPTYMREAEEKNGEGATDRTGAGEDGELRPEA